MVQADVASAGQRLRLLTDLDEQQLVMGPAAAEERDRDAAQRTVVRSFQLLPAEHVSVERGGPLDVAHVEDDVSQLLDLHAASLPGAPRAKQAGA